MKNETSELCNNFIDVYKKFDINTIQTIDDIKICLKTYEGFLKDLIGFYNEFDKEYQKGRNETNRQFRDRLFSLIQICQNLVIIPLNNKLQSIEANKSIKMGRWSVYLGLGSIILAILGVAYSFFLSSKNPTIQTLDQSTSKIIASIKTEINSLQTALDSLQISYQKSVLEFEKTNSKLNDVKMDISKVKGKIIDLERKMPAKP